MCEIGHVIRHHKYGEEGDDCAKECGGYPLIIRDNREKVEGELRYEHIYHGGLEARDVGAVGEENRNYYCRQHVVADLLEYTHGSAQVAQKTRGVNLKKSERRAG